MQWYVISIWSHQVLELCDTWFKIKKCYKFILLTTVSMGLATKRTTKLIYLYFIE